MPYSSVRAYRAEDRCMACSPRWSRVLARTRHWYSMAPRSWDCAMIKSFLRHSAEELCSPHMRAKWPRCWDWRGMKWKKPRRQSRSRQRGDSARRSCSRAHKAGSPRRVAGCFVLPVDRLGSVHRARAIHSRGSLRASPRGAPRPVRPRRGACGRMGRQAGSWPRKWQRWDFSHANCSPKSRRSSAGDDANMTANYCWAVKAGSTVGPSPRTTARAWSRRPPSIAPAEMRRRRYRAWARLHT